MVVQVGRNIRIISKYAVQEQLTTMDVLHCGGVAGGPAVFLRRGFFVIGVVLVLSLCLSQKALCAAEVGEGFDVNGRPGPWGELEISYIQISPPMDIVPELRVIARGRMWHFPEWDRENLADFISASPLSEDMKGAFIKKIEADPQTGGVQITPTTEEVAGLSAEARAYIYNVLSHYKINKAHDKAHRYASPSLDEWMRGVQLSAGARSTMEKLLYRNGNMLFFVDVPILMDSISSLAEKQDVLRALGREKTMLIKLRLGDDSDVDALTRYWGEGGRASQVHPLLESVKERVGERTLDIVHLLPSFVRERVYTYPDIREYSSEEVTPQDCHWTSLNFFNREADNNYGNAAKVKECIESQYETVESKELRLGDLLLYMEDRHLIHSAVYIASDIVFTKNGTNYSSPWMFMYMSDMEQYYPQKEPLKVLCLRSRGRLLTRRQVNERQFPSTN